MQGAQLVSLGVTPETLGTRDCWAGSYFMKHSPQHSLFPYCGRNRTSGSRVQPTHLSGNRTAQHLLPGRGVREAAGFPSSQLFPWLTQHTHAVLQLLSTPSFSGERFMFGLSCRPQHSLDVVCVRLLRLLMCIFPGQASTPAFRLSRGAVVMEGR